MKTAPHLHTRPDEREKNRDDVQTEREGEEHEYDGHCETVQDGNVVEPKRDVAHARRERQVLAEADVMAAPWLPEVASTAANRPRCGI